jgi:hypothetical protein
VSSSPSRARHSNSLTSEMVRPIESLEETSGSGSGSTSIDVPWESSSSLGLFGAVGGVES